MLLEAEDRRIVSEDLRTLTHHRDPAVRGRAALALGRIGLPRGAARLLEMTGDPAAGVRTLAAFGLGRIDTALAGRGEAGLQQRILEGLVALLRDPAAPVAAQAAWALGVQAGRVVRFATDTADVEDTQEVEGAGEVGDAGGVGDVGRAVREALAAVLTPSSGASAEVVARALGAWSRLRGADAAVAVRWLGSPDPELRLAAARTVARSGDPNGLVALVPLLDDTDPRVRSAAARGLRDLPWSVGRARALGLLEDRDWRVVAEGLAWIGAAWRELGADERVTEEGLAAVLRATLRRDPHARVGALAALGSVAADWPVALDRLLEALDDEDPSVRLKALEALAAARPTVLDPALERARRRYGLEESPPGRPEAAATVAAGFHQRPLEAAALVHLLGAAADEDARRWVLFMAEHGPLPARVAALRVWSDREPARAAAFARAFLQDGPSVLRAAAAREVSRLRGRGRLPGRGAEAGGGPGEPGRGEPGRAEGGRAEPGQAEPGRADEPWPDLLWRVQRDLTAPGEVETRLAVLGALHDLEPELLQLRASLLIDDPRWAVRRWALDRRLREFTPELLERVVAPADAGRSRDDYRDLARRVLALEPRPPRLEVAGERGSFVVELHPDRAPLTTLRLLELAAAGRLEDLPVHRVSPDFVLYTGDPTATGLGGVGPVWHPEATPGRFGEGSLGQVPMAPDLGGSRVFMTRGPRPGLDGLRPLLGSVVDGRRAALRVQRGDVLSWRPAPAPAYAGAAARSW